MRRRATALLILLVLVAGAVTPSRASRRSPFEISAWVVDWSDSLLRGTLLSLSRSDEILTGLDFFWYRLSPDGVLIPSSELTRLHREILHVSAQRSLSRMATLVNDTVAADGAVVRLKDPDLVHRILAEPAWRARLISQARAAVIDGNFDGLDLDFENLAVEDRDAFTNFAGELGQTLHRAGKRLVVTVQPPAHRSREEDSLPAQDLAGLAAAADEVRIMAYHLHFATTEPGPAAPLPWLDHLVQQALPAVSREKLSLAIYVGGWRWSGGSGEQVSFLEAHDLARELGVRVEWSEVDSVPYFRATSDEGPVEVWFEDGCSLSRKIALAKRFGLRGVGLWHLGKEDPALFEALRSQSARCL